MRYLEELLDLVEAIRFLLAELRKTSDPQVHSKAAQLHGRLGEFAEKIRGEFAKFEPEPEQKQPEPAKNKKPEKDPAS